MAVAISLILTFFNKITGYFNIRSGKMQLSPLYLRNRVFLQNSVSVANS